MLATYEDVMVLMFGPLYEGVQNVWGEETVPENAHSRWFLDPSNWASALLRRGFLYRNTEHWHLRGVENVPYEGGFKTPVWEGCHSWGFPPPSFFHPPPHPKDPAVLKRLRRSKFTTHSKFTTAQWFTMATPPYADTIFLGFAGIFPLKAGFMA